MLDRRHVLAGIGALAALPAGAQDKLRIVASFSILGDFARAVGGDGVEVATLVGPDQDAHVFEPSPADARALAAARLVVVNGLGFEGWMTRLVRASGFKGPTVVAADGVATIRLAADAHGHRRTGRDPHVWQDPRRATTMVENVAKGLAAADSGRAEIYRRNAAAYATQLAEVDAWIGGRVDAVPKARRKVVTSHDAFGYFADRYGVEFRAPRGVSTESEPSAADVARIIRYVRRERVKVIFMENVTDPRLVERIAGEGGARVGGRLYPDALSAPGGPAATSLAMMRHTATLLVEAMLAE